MMQPLPPREPRQAALAGVGFALAFGWVWSGALRDLWFADILTGTLFSGQGTTVFFAVLTAVFLAGGAASARGATSARDAARLRCSAWLFPLCAHGAALLPLAASLLVPGEAGDNAVAAGLGMAGGLSGLYWGSLLLRLPSLAAGLALAVAWLGISGLTGLTLLCRAESFPWPPLLVLPGCACLALCLAVFPALLPTLNRRIAARTAEGLEPERRTVARQRSGTAALCLAVVALGALFSADGYTEPALLPQCGLETMGAVLALPLFRSLRTLDNRPKRIALFASLTLPLAFPLALLPLTALWLPVFSWSLHLATGALLAGIVMHLAGRFPELPEPADEPVSFPAARRLAGYALAALPLALNAGFYAGARVGLVWGGENAALTVFVFACLAALLPLSFSLRRQATRSGGAVSGSKSAGPSLFLEMQMLWRAMAAGLPRLTRAEIMRSVVTGCGFAMVMGWIWFPGMQILCPPVLLAVAPPVGREAMLFLAMLSLGYPLLGLIVGRTSGKLNPHLLHGATLPFIIMLAYNAPGFSSLILLFALFAGLASVCAGLYWLTAMLSHRPACVGISFVIAGLAAAGITLLATILPQESLKFFLPLLVVAAWPLVLLQPESPPRKASGRTGRSATNTDILFLVPALFLLGFLEKLLLTGNGPASPALLCLCNALGGATALVLSLAAPGMRGWKSACLALLLPIFGLMTGWGTAFSQTTTGMVSAVVVMELSVYFDRMRVNRITGVGIMAGSISMLFNIAYAIGDSVIAALQETEIVTVAVSLTAAGAVVFLGNAMIRAKQDPDADERAVASGSAPSAAPPGSDAFALSPPDTAAEKAEPAAVFSLTPAEQRIALLLAQGYTNTAISETLDIAPTTTRVHLRSIHKKLGTDTREDLVERIQWIAKAGGSFS